MMFLEFQNMTAVTAIGRPGFINIQLKIEMVFIHVNFTSYYIYNQRELWCKNIEIGLLLPSHYY